MNLVPELALAGVYHEGDIFGEEDVDYVIINKGDIDLMPVAIQLPPRPKTLIPGIGNHYSSQTFTYTKVPNHLVQIQETSKDLLEYRSRMNPEDIAFIKKEFERVKNGYWFMNNGKPTYITGDHYFFLNYWRDSNTGGRLEYRKNNREFFIFWDWITKHDRHEGLAFFTKRRGGKTEMASAIMYLRTILNNKQKSGMQSKTELDAELIFNNIVLQWRDYMPWFFKPLYAGDNDTPSKELNFDKPRESSASAGKFKNMKVRKSKLNFKPSGEAQYDGQELNWYYGDEFSKTERCDVWKRHKITRKCCRNSTGDLVGKMLYTTTVEFLDKEAGQAAVSMFNRSSLRSMIDKGRLSTESGLLVYFCPAKQSTVFDKYGNPNEQEAERRIMEERRGLQGKDLADEKRKNPNSIAEAFIGDAFECHFNIENIQAQEMNIGRIENENKTVRGRLIWKNRQADTEVVFKPDENGPWLIHEFPTTPNQFYVSEARHTTPSGASVAVKVLKGPTMYAAGTDPFDHHRDVLSVNSDRKSNGAAHFFKLPKDADWRKSIILPEDERYEDRFRPEHQRDHKFVAQYIARPDSPNDYYEDMIMGCCFWGCKMLMESQKSGIVNYFLERGYMRFVAPRPRSTMPPKMQGKKRDLGMPSNNTTMPVGFDFMEHYIENECYKVWFPETLQDLKFISIKQRTKYDVGVSAIITLMHVNDILEKFVESTNKTKINIQAYDVPQQNDYRKAVPQHDGTKHIRAY